MDITDDATTQTQKLKDAYAAAKTNVTGFNGALTKVKSIAKSVGISLANMAATMAISFVIGKVIEGIDYLANYSSNMEKAAQEQADSAREAADTAVEQNAALEETIQKYKELKESGKDDAQTREQIKGLQDEIANSVGGQADNLDLVNGKLDEQLKKLEKISLKQLTESKSTLKANVNASENAADKKQTAYNYSRDVNAESLGLNIREDNIAFVNGGSLLDIGQTTVMLHGNPEERLEALSRAIEKLESNDLSDSEFYTSIVKLRDEYRESVDAVTDATEKFNNQIVSIEAKQMIVSGETVESAKDFENFRKALTAAVVAGDEFKGTTEDIKKSIDSVMQTQFPEWIGKTAETQVSYSLADISDEIGTLTENIASLGDKYAILGDAQKELSDTGVITADTMQKIIDNDLLGYLEATATGLQVNTDAYRDNIIQAKAKAKADLSVSFAEDLLKLAQDGVADSATNTGAALDEVGISASGLTRKMALAALESNSVADALVNVQRAAGKEVSWEGKTKQFEELAQNYLQASQFIDQLAVGTDQLTEKDYEYQKALKTQKELLNDEKEGLEETKKALDDKSNALQKQSQEYQDAYGAINSLVEQFIALIKYEQNAVKESKKSEIDTLKKANDAYQERIDKMQKAIDLENQQIKNQEELAEKQRTLSDINKELSMLSGDNSAVAKNRRNELLSLRGDAQKDLNDTIGEQTREKRKNALDEMAEGYQKMTDAKTASLEKEIELVDEYLKKEGVLREDAMRRIDNRSQESYVALRSYVTTYTSQSEAEFQRMWNSAYQALDKYTQGHFTTFQVMGYLSQQIYITGLQIDSLKIQIDNTNNAISNTGNAIDGVSKKLDALGSSMQNYATDVERVRQAAGEAIEEAEKALSYQPSQFSMGGQASTGAFDENGRVDSRKNRKYSVTLSGTTYTVVAKSEEEAISELFRLYAQKYPDSASRNPDKTKNLIRMGLQRYATGTRRSGKEVAIIGDDGQEFVLDQPAQGQYAQLNNAAVFNARQTDELWNLSKDPMDYIQSKVFTSAASFLSSSSNVTNAPTLQISAPIAVNGNATREGIEALSRKLETDLFPKMTKSIMKEMVKVGKLRFR